MENKNQQQNKSAVDFTNLKTLNKLMLGNELNGFVSGLKRAKQGLDAYCKDLKDYKAKLMMMPPKFGAPFRSGVIENNNKIEMYLLGMNSKGKLDSALPQTLVNNIVEYMSHYKNLTDYIEIKSGKIYNIGIGIDVFVDKNYTTADVVGRVISKIKEYFDVNKHDMGEDIFVGDLEKEITQIDGVLSIIDLRLYTIYGDGYSPTECPLPKKRNGEDNCYGGLPNTFGMNEGEWAELDLQQTDYVLANDFNAMFEILNENDIQVRCKNR